MALHSMVVFLLLVGHLCCTSQADASALRRVRFGQHGDLPPVVFELHKDVPYRLEAGSDPTLIRLIFPTLRFTSQPQVGRARTGLMQEVRWSTNASQVMADIVLKHPGTARHAERLQAPPRVVVDIARRNDGEVQKESEGAQGQGTVPAVPRATDEHPQQGAATALPQAASPTAQTPLLPPVSILISTQLLEQAEKQWAARQLEAYQCQEAFFDVLHTFFAYKLSLPPTETGHPDLLYPLVTSDVWLGLLDEAQSLLPTLLDAAAMPIQRAHIALAQATLFAQGGRDEVVTALLHPLQQFTDPTMRAQALLLTESAWRAQRPDDVVRYAGLGEALLTGAAERAKFFSILGKAYEVQGDVNKAIQTCHKCAEVPEAGERAETCLLRAAGLHAAQGQHKPALALYERVLQTFPHSYTEGFLFRIAESHRQQFDKTQMRATCTRLREHTQDAFWHKVATEYLEQAQWQERFQERLAVFQNSLMR